MDWYNPEIWVALGFVILVAAAFRPVKKALLGMLDARTDAIRKTIDEAASLREEAQQLLAEYQRKQRDAMKETEQMVAHAREEAVRLQKEGEEKLEETIKRREQMAMEKIAQAEADALREVRAMSVEVAIAATRNLIAGQIGPEKSTALLDKSIADLSQKLH